MKQSRRAPRRALGLIGALVAVASVGAASAEIVSGCQQAPVLVPTRSLELSGKASFVCLGPEDPIFRPLSECSVQQFSSICQYAYEDDAGIVDAQATINDAGTLVGTYYPHLYALVTQRKTGEVAVVDTSVAAGVLDENPREPGANFLHIGGLPTGIVSTPGSVATFVGVGEIGHAGIFALPSAKIRPASSFGVPDTCIGPTDASVEIPELTSWPACALPAAPGDILLIDDPGLPDGTQRPSCDDAPQPITPDTSFISATENRTGRPKLVVALPDLGGIAVYDAEEIFDRPAGSFAPCGKGGKPERWVPLEVDLTGLADQPPLPAGLACANPLPNDQPLQDGGAGGAYHAQPGGMSYADGKLYVADLSAPLIHVIDMHDDATGLPTPCNPVEQAPLLPTSAEDPARVVFASKVAVAPVLTPDLKRYLFATDVLDSSAMIFDVGPDSTSRRPLVRAHPERNPFMPRDRVKFPAPPADIIVTQSDFPRIDPVTGVATAGVECNPDPNALTCTATAHDCDIRTSYQTAPDYTTGAGPTVLRGEFAFAALTSGKLAVIDVADFDAPCRGPEFGSSLAGCAGDATSVDPFHPPHTSADLSCNVVSPGEPRALYWEAVGATPGNHVPGLQTFPLLYDINGANLVDTAQSTAPRMVATLPAGTLTGSMEIPACTQTCDPLGCGVNCDTLPGCPLQLFVGGQQTPLDFRSHECSTSCSPAGGPCSQSSECCPGADGVSGVCNANKVCQPATCTADGLACVPGATVDACNAGNCAPPTTHRWDTPSATKAFVPGAIGNNSALAMNLEDPRAHIADQNWTVTFEGPIPGFTERLAFLSRTGPKTATLTDPNSRFCDLGVLGAAAFAEALSVQPKPGLAADQLADYVQITNDLPAATDPYWTATAAAGGPASCTYADCFSIFGSIEQLELNSTRDLRILEAYEDHVDVEPRLGAACGATDSNGNTVCDKLVDEIKCCFPTAITFNVRAGNQWVAVGDQVGFLHHVVADRSGGACRNACDTTFSRKNGRIVETPPALDPAGILDRDPSTIDPSPSFLNPMFRFGIYGGAKRCAGDADCGDPKLRFTCDVTRGMCTQTAKPACIADSDCPKSSCDAAAKTCKPVTCSSLADCPSGDVCRVLGGSGACVTALPVPTARDSSFRFSTNGSFVPLLPNLSPDGTTLVEPQSLTYLPATMELAITDGSVSGLILVNLQFPSTISRAFF